MAPTLAAAFLLLLSISNVLAASLPVITLSHPLSQQFPPVARVKQAFSWTFSDSTFYTSTSYSTSSLQYTALDLPPWLGFTASNRSFSGYPTESDIGSYAVQITASTSDGQSSLTDTVTLAVTERNCTITITDPVAIQLVANDTAITSAFPYGPASPFYPGVRIPPNWSFSLGFQTYTFTASSKIFYSASMIDGSPLPLWLDFSANSPTFNGVTPLLAAGEPTLYQVVLSGSDVYGYSDVQQAFNITIAAHDFALVKPTASLNLTSGYPLNDTLDVLSSFTLDAESLRPDEVANTSLDASGLSWLSYNPSNSSLFGTPPNDQKTVSVPLSITDIYGDTLNTTVSLAFFPSLFTTDQLRPALATSSEAFNVSLSQYFTNGTSGGINLTTTFDPKDASTWLSFYTSNNTLQGTAPGDVDYDSVTVLFRAQDLVTHAWSHAEMMVSLAPNGTTNVNHMHHHGLSTINKAGLASVGAIVGGLIFLFLILTACRRCSSGEKHKSKKDINRDLDVEKWAIETPAMEYAEKMGEPASVQMLVSREEHDVLSSLPRLSSGTSTKRGFIRNPFAKRKVIPKISNPIIMPSFSNAAFQAQLAAAVDSAGIVRRGESTYMADIATDVTTSEFTESGMEGERSGASMRSVTDDSQFNGHSSRASWESEPPFVWTGADTPKHQDQGQRQGQDNESSVVTSYSTHESADLQAPVQRSDFRPTPPTQHDITLPSANTSSSDEGISIDNIHFPTESDIAHTEASSDHDAIITIASRIDARRTIESPVAASSASSHTEKASIATPGPSPVMTTQSRLVSFGKQRTVTVSNGGARSISQTAVVGSTSVHTSELPSRPPIALVTTRSSSPSPPSSLPSLPALPTLSSATSSRIARVPVTAQRILLGVAEPFHFYPPLSISPSRSTSSASTAPSREPGVDYMAFIEQGGESLEALPSWLHFEDMELWGAPEEGDRGVWDVRVVERVTNVTGMGERVVGRFALEVRWLTS